MRPSGRKDWAGANGRQAIGDRSVGCDGHGSSRRPKLPLGFHPGNCSYRPSDAVRTKGINAARATGPIRNLPHDLREQLHLSCHPAFALLIPVDLVDGAFNCTKANYRRHSIGPMALPRKRPHFFCGIIKTRSTIFYESTAIHSLANESQFR